MSIRILVVDDAAVFRRAITEALSGVPGLEVIGTAASGQLALARIAELKPDLITLDIEMPDISGIRVLREITARRLSVGAIVLSASSERGRDLTIEALELGAFDFIAKPEGKSAQDSVSALRERLLPAISNFRRQHEIHGILRPRGRAAVPPPAPLPLVSTVKEEDPGVSRERRTGPPFVLIAVSTGGPAALAQVIPALPRDLGVPVFIVQHMPPLFTQSLARSLTLKSVLPVHEAVDGEIAAKNIAYLAPGGKQLKLMAGTRGDIALRITDDPPENNCKPAADYLFRSAAQNLPGPTVAVVLTGMGNDGTLGLRALRKTGCFSIAQDEASSTVFGMPREAINAGLIDTVLPLPQIAPAIVRAVRESGR